MKRIPRFFPALPLLSLLAACASGPAESGGPAPRPGGEGEVTIWDGVYSVDQAQRGERASWANCYSCHSPGEWSSETFMGASSTWRLGDLFNVIRQSMPYDAPGSLSDETYGDIVAYILSLRGAPAGDAELPATIEELDKILVTVGDGRRREP